MLKAACLGKVIESRAESHTQKGGVGSTQRAPLPLEGFQSNFMIDQWLTAAAALQMRHTICDFVRVQLIVLCLPLRERQYLIWPSPEARSLLCNPRLFSRLRHDARQAANLNLALARVESEIGKASLQCERPDWLAGCSPHATPAG